jgi:hypothetical protein
MTAVKQPRPPSELGAAGRQLWRAIVADAAGQGLELDARDAEWLKQAGRIADRIAEMEAALVGAEPAVAGHAKQPVAHPLFAEVRMHRQLLSQVLARLKTDVPEEPARVVPDAGARSAAARLAANARWGRA